LKASSALSDTAIGAVAEVALTKTQRFILAVALDAQQGVFCMGRADRNGTRLVGKTKTGTPIIVAYQTPEFFLKSRGLIEQYGNEPYHYRITDVGKKELKRCR
jgi:hypothetical protein